MTELKRNEKIDVVEILKDLDKYEPRRRGWTWREKAEDQHMGRLSSEISKPLKQSAASSGQVHGRHRPAADADHHH